MWPIAIGLGLLLGLGCNSEDKPSKKVARKCVKHRWVEAGRHGKMKKVCDQYVAEDKPKAPSVDPHIHWPYGPKL